MSEYNAQARMDAFLNSAGEDEPYPTENPDDLNPKYVGIVFSPRGQWIAISNEGDRKWTRRLSKTEK